jgi:hypothetical protein
MMQDKPARTPFYATVEINEGHQAKGIIVLEPAWDQELYATRKLPARSSSQGLIFDAEPAVVHW